MNYRDLQNISNLSQQILVEGAKEEHNVLNRWPYTSPYLQESTEVVEEKKPLPVGKMDAKAKELKSKFHKSKVGTPEASKLLSRLGHIVAARDSKVVSDSYDLYDIILTHLLDEGYADTQEAAEAIMVNMSEDWRESIFEAEVLAQKGGVPGTVQMNKTREGGFLGIGSKEVSKPVPGSFKEKDVSSKDAARYNTGIDKKFGSADNIDNTSAANVQYAANRAGHSGYMKVEDPGSLPNTGIPNRPTPGRASDQNQARQMSGDIVRMNRRQFDKTLKNWYI